MRRRSIVLLAVLAVLFLSFACRTPAGRTPGMVIDDGTITTKVKSDLLANNITRGLAITVSTFEGQVTLTGAVDNEEQKKTAEDITKKVYGVKKVNNLIQIKKT